MNDTAFSSDVALLEPPTESRANLATEQQSMSVHAFGITDPGKVRKSNEDQFLIAVLLKALRVESTSLPQERIRHGSDRNYLFMVADGMGGHAGGEKASALAIHSVESFILESFRWFAQCKGKEEDQVLTDFQSALRHANARVLAEAAERPELRGMGTTLTLAYSANDILFVAHVGDSRCYLGRQGVLYRLTRDHTVVEEMVRRGALSEEEAAHHRWRHVISNAVGADSSEVLVELHKIHLEDGDRVLLCSDGLTDMLSEKEINQILRIEIEPEPACRKLVARANGVGGRDNITALVVHFHAIGDTEG